MFRSKSVCEVLWLDITREICFVDKLVGEEKNTAQIERYFMVVKERSKIWFLRKQTSERLRESA